jgi:hypothetical protein
LELERCAKVNLVNYYDNLLSSLYTKDGHFYLTINSNIFSPLHRNYFFRSYFSETIFFIRIYIFSKKETLYNVYIYLDKGHFISTVQNKKKLSKKTPKKSSFTNKTILYACLIVLNTNNTRFEPYKTGKTNCK